MTKSTITRERLQEIAEDGFLKHGESKELARMALAAMDSEPDCKERKLFCSTDTTRMRKTISVSAGTEDAPLYRHAQPAPSVPDERDKTVDADDYPLLWSFNKGWNACRAAMLYAGTLTNEGTKQAGNSPVIPCAEQRIADAVELLKQAAPAMLADNGGPNGPLVGRLKSPAIPDGYVMVPKEPTKEMIDAGWLHYMSTKNPSSKGTYKAMLAAAPQPQNAPQNIPEIIPNELIAAVNRLLDSNGSRGCYNAIKCYDAHIEVERLLAAAPQSPGSEPATVPGKWILVSERMPDVGVKVLCFPAEDEPIHAVFNGQLWLQDVSWSGSDDPIDNVIPVPVTHWMSLPAAPQEVKGE